MIATCVARLESYIGRSPPTVSGRHLLSHHAAQASNISEPQVLEHFTGNSTRWQILPLQSYLGTPLHSTWLPHTLEPSNSQDRWQGQKLQKQLHPDQLQQQFESLQSSLQDSNGSKSYHELERAASPARTSNHSATDEIVTQHPGAPFWPSVWEKMEDRDPDTGDRFPTVLAMREAKLRDWLRVTAQLSHAGHVTCRDFMADPRYCCT